MRLLEKTKPVAEILAIAKQLRITQTRIAEETGLCVQTINLAGKGHSSLNTTNYNKVIDVINKYIKRS